MYPPMTHPPSPLLDMSHCFVLPRAAAVFEEDSARGRRKWGSQGGESGRGGVCTLLGSVLKLARLACVVRD